MLISSSCRLQKLYQNKTSESILCFNEYRFVYPQSPRRIKSHEFWWISWTEVKKNKLWKSSNFYINYKNIKITFYNLIFLSLCSKNICKKEEEEPPPPAGNPTQKICYLNEVKDNNNRNTCQNSNWKEIFFFRYFLLDETWNKITYSSNSWILSFKQNPIE